jgi:hypothetical protein
MNFRTTTGQALKAFSGAALLGLGMDQVSCRLGDLAWRILNELASVLFWGLLSSLEASETRIFGEHLHLLACPLEIASLLQPLLHLIGRAL